MDVELCVKSLADHLAALLGRFADDKGVNVLFHREEPRILFRFDTPDRMGIKVDYDINETSKEYIANMVEDLQKHINTEREKSRDLGIIIAKSLEDAKGVH